MRHTSKRMQMLNSAPTNASSQSTNSATGKLVLAAIVHPDTDWAADRQSNGGSAKSSIGQEVSGDLGERYDGKRTKRQRHQVAHDGQVNEQKGAKRSKSRLARLLSIKSGKKQTRTLIDSAQVNNQQPTGGANNLPPKSEGASAEQSEQVIEFRFDLIVELANRDQWLNRNTTTTAGCHIGRLNDSINQLLESFVLDSNDVCLLSVGRQPTEFDYLIQLARHSLANSFQLLQPDGAQDRQLVSIELSGLLFRPEGERQIRLVDLLLNGNCDLSADGCQASAVDCNSLQLAELSMQRMTERLSGEPAGKLLLFGLKLKRRINGGLFSNRMCLIHYEPDFFHLRPIFDNIFNGQALAYLKRHKTQVRLVDGCATSDIELADKTDSSLRNAEWLLYKQLSSALIKTLLAVHVHRLAATPTGGVQEQQLDLMALNLELLEFARSIQRASASRLKRRKRHLRSHMASSNLSVNSNVSASIKQPVSSPMHRSTMGRRTSGQRRCSSPTRRQVTELQELRCCAQVQRKTSLEIDSYRSQYEHRRGGHKDSWIRRRAASSGRHVYELTESSSLSTSSGSGRLAHLPPTSTYLSDSDSMASANLNSCSSSSAHTRQCLALGRQRLSRHRRDIELRWLEKRSRKIQSPEQSSSPAEISIQSAAVKLNKLQAKQSSNVIQIDCPNDADDTTTTSTLCSQFRPVGNESTLQLDSSLVIDKASLADTDNVSDIYSVIAPEPPKQLKLEQFLHQLSNIIAPSTEGKEDETPNDCKLAQTVVTDYGGRLTAANKLAVNCPGDKNNNKTTTLADEDDEDCKSHSSILEHLSSLALESNSKLSGRRPEAPLSGTNSNYESPPSPTEWPKPPEITTDEPHLRANQLEVHHRQWSSLLGNNCNHNEQMSAPKAACNGPHRSSSPNELDQLYAMVIRRGQNVHT